MAKLSSYAGLRALVTGASSGIGRALALRLARLGARVALVARREGELVALAAEIGAAGGEAFALPCDVAEADQALRAAERATERFGGVDLLVNNAGAGGHRRFLAWELADMERLMRVNYLGSLYFTKALLPQMVERGRGFIVFMASVAGKLGLPDEAAYSATKFAQLGLAEGLGLEVEDAGVHVLSVCPGAVRTPFFSAADLERLPPATRRTMIEAEDVVDATLRGLARGAREVTVPRGIGVAYVVRALAPGFMRRNVKRSTLGARPRG